MVKGTQTVATIHFLETFLFLKYIDRLQDVKLQPKCFLLQHIRWDVSHTLMLSPRRAIVRPQAVRVEIVKANKRNRLTVIRKIIDKIISKSHRIMDGKMPMKFEWIPTQ